MKFSFGKVSILLVLTQYWTQIMFGNLDLESQVIHVKKKIQSRCLIGIPGMGAIQTPICHKSDRTQRNSRTGFMRNSVCVHDRKIA